jgi:hypothetical protein
MDKPKNFLVSLGALCPGMYLACASLGMILALPKPPNGKNNHALLHWN